MLNNQTPRKTAKTKKGRQLLEALLAEYESNAERTEDEFMTKLFNPDPDEVRARLGLIDLN